MNNLTNYFKYILKNSFISCWKVARALQTPNGIILWQKLHHEGDTWREGDIQLIFFCNNLLMISVVSIDKRVQFVNLQLLKNFVAKFFEEVVINTFLCCHWDSCNSTKTFNFLFFWRANVIKDIHSVFSIGWMNPIYGNFPNFAFTFLIYL